MALEKVKEILDAKEKSNESQGSDKENDQEEMVKTYSKKPQNNQKVLSAMNGTMTVSSPKTEPKVETETEEPSTSIVSF